MGGKMNKEKHILSHLQIFFAVIGFCILVFVVIFPVIYVLNLNSDRYPKDYRDNAIDFCKHYNMAYYYESSGGFSTLYNFYCVETKDDKVIAKHKIIKLNEKWTFEQ